jgi:hypothetical protein
MTRDEMLAYLQDAVGRGLICGFVYQRVREYVSDVEPIRTCHMLDTDHEYEDSVRCDVCQATFNRPWEPFKFCPNCGAMVVRG